MVTVIQNPEPRTRPGHGLGGRGALSNRSGRFENEHREPVADGWQFDPPEQRPGTLVTEENARRIITTNKSPDLGFDRSINPYRGCEHGCSYCFARPTHAFMGLSAGLDFETRLFAKSNAADLLRRELAHKNYRPKTIAIGTNTDPYQPIERSRKIMRQVLTVLAEHNHPVAIVTKSALVVRDIDLLAEMAEKGLAKVALSVTTLDGRLARRMEPRASVPARRLEAIRTLSEAGIPTAVMVAPVVPGLNDQEIEALLAAARDAGATEAGYILLRLPLEVRGLFHEWLHRHYPDRAARVIAITRSLHGGRDYDATWGKRMRGTGPYAWSIGRRFEMACRRLGLNTRHTRLNTGLFSRPLSDGQQLSLL